MIKLGAVTITDKTGQEIKTTMPYLSDYLADPPMTPAECVVAVELLIETLSFAQTTADFVAEILNDEKWSYRRLKDAIKHVIKTQKYREIKPSDVLSWDKRILVLTYEQMLAFDTGGVGFKRIYIPGLRNNRYITNGKPTDIGWWTKIDTEIPDTWTEIIRKGR